MFKIELAILITGGSGKLGNELVREFPDSLHPPSVELNISDPTSISKYFNSHNVDMIIHCAALTSQLNCERNPSLAWAVNVKGTFNLVSQISKIKPTCPFVYISTPAVFKCDKGCYSEYSVPNPCNQYGATKLVAETIAQSLQNCTIVRTNFIPRFWAPERAYIDRFGSHIYADTAAKAVRELIEKNYTGLVHVCGSRRLSLYELAQLNNPKVIPITVTEEYSRLLPMDMTLISDKWHTYELR